MIEQIVEPRGATSFVYQKPPEFSQPKEIVMLARTDRMAALVQVLKSKGGENNLHKHNRFDGFWMVLKGRVRFYGENDVVLDELGPHEGILIPRGTLYWFENCGEGDLELLQVDAYDKSMPDLREVMADRVNVKPVNYEPNKVPIHDGRKL